jgi:hypothetical protein
MEGTRRQRIAQLLKEQHLTAFGISKAVGAPIKTILDDLPHIRRSLKGNEKWVVEHAECGRCGFVFRDRSRFTTPSRCPKCRGESIRDAVFGIE